MEKKIEIIIERLGNVHHEERIAALRDLSDVKNELAKELLAEALADKHAEVRKAAMNIIANIDPENIEILLGMLNDPDSEIRKDAMERIKLKGSSLKGMVKSLKQSNQPERIILAIGVCGETGDSDSIDYLVKMLTHNSSEVRSAAKETILKTASPDCKKRLVSFILDEIEDSSRSKLLLSLCDKKSPEAAEEIMSCLEDRFWKIRCSAAQAIGELKYEPAIEKLKNLTQDHNAAVRYYAKKSLNLLGVPFKKWTITASEQLPEHENKKEPVKFTKSSKLSKPAKSTSSKSPSIKELLFSKDAKQRMECLDSLDLSDIQQNIDDLEQMIKGDSSEIIRSKAVKKVSLYICDKTRVILNNALKDSDYRVRANAIEGIEKTGGEDAIMILTPLLMDEDNRIRTNAAKALHALGDKGIEKKLVNLLKNGEAWMRDSAAYMINEVGSKAVLADLFEVYKIEKEKDVAEKLILSLEKFATATDLDALYNLKSDNTVPHAILAGQLFDKLGKKYTSEYNRIIKKNSAPVNISEEKVVVPAKEDNNESLLEIAVETAPVEKIVLTETNSLDFNEVIELDLTDDTALDLTDDTALDLTDDTALDLTDDTTLDLTDDTTLDLTDDTTLDLTDDTALDLTDDTTLDLIDDTSLEFEDFAELDFQPGESVPAPEPVKTGAIEKEVIDLNILDDSMDLDFENLEITAEEPAKRQEGQDLPPMAIPTGQEDDKNKYNEELSLDFESLGSDDSLEDNLNFDDLELDAPVEDVKSAEVITKDPELDILDLDFENLELNDTTLEASPEPAKDVSIDGPGFDSSVEIDDAMIDSLFADDLSEETNVINAQTADKPTDDFVGDADLDDLSKLLDENL